MEKPSTVTKQKFWLIGLFALGVITGRSLPQWNDIANSPYKYGSEIMYFSMCIIAIILIINHHKFEGRKK